MADLIDRDDAIKRIDRQRVVDKSVIKRLLYTMPTVKSEIINCKDCKFYIHTNRLLKVGICSLLPAHFGDDGYCSEAERRSDG